jgi:alpha-glucosidase
VANGLVKDPGYPDIGTEDGRPVRREPTPYSDQDLLHEIVKDWRKVVEEHDGVLVAEAWVDSWERLANYLRSDEYHQAFEFDFMLAPWDPGELRAVIDAAVEGSTGVGSVPTWVLSNHDIVRQVTRYGLPQELDARDWLLDGDRSLLDQDLGLQRARAAALLMLGLPGSAYLYQGDELGLPEVDDLPLSELEDPTWARSGHTRKGRDGCRVPIPWSIAGSSYGFGANGSWLPQPTNWGTWSVEAQEGKTGSTLELYREAIRRRKEHLAGTEAFDWVDAGDDILAFDRQGVRVMVNLGQDSVPLSDGEILLSSAEVTGYLPPDTAVWIHR